MQPLSSTMYFERGVTRTWGGRRSGRCSEEVLGYYQKLVGERRLSWTEHHRFLRRLGAGGQGIVFLSERRGTDGFTLPVAIKIFSPEHYESDHAYDAAMARIAKVAARVAQIQQDNLLDVHNWLDRHRIRMMEMEWVEGYDLRFLLVNRMLEWVQSRVSAKRWKHVTNVIVTPGPWQPRIKPGVAIFIIRNCLAALSALHREGIIHGDIKPSNIMLKRTGNAKIIDVGSAFETECVPPLRTCTPTYAAPEVLEGQTATPRSDLTSLGYVLIELLSGHPPFPGANSYTELLEAKRFLAQRLPSMLQDDIVRYERLMGFCRKLLAPDPEKRFPSAEAAELSPDGAAAIQQELVIGKLASEYDNEIRLWLAEMDGFPPKAAAE